jgi:hypothetical protein
MRIGSRRRDSLSPLHADPFAKATTGYTLDDLYTFVFFDIEAHVTPFAHIPRDSIRDRSLMSAVLMHREQDDTYGPPDEIMLAVHRGDRVFVVETPARVFIPAPADCKPLFVKNAQQFRECYDARVVPTARFQPIIAQIREILRDLPAR